MWIFGCGDIFVDDIFYLIPEYEKTTRGFNDDDHIFRNDIKYTLVHSWNI